MSAEIKKTPTNKDRETVVAYIEREREEWLPLHHRAVRAGGMNGEANREAELAMERINPLLEELHAMGAVAVRGAQA